MGDCDWVIFDGEFKSWNVPLKRTNNRQEPLTGLLTWIVQKILDENLSQRVRAFDVYIKSKASTDRIVTSNKLSCTSLALLSSSPLQQLFRTLPLLGTLRMLLACWTGRAVRRSQNRRCRHRHTALRLNSLRLSFHLLRSDPVPLLTRTAGPSTLMPASLTTWRFVTLLPRRSQAPTRMAGRCTRTPASSRTLCTKVE